MIASLRKAVAILGLEERILVIASFVSCIGLLLPWISGEWLGSEQEFYSGLGFFTAVMGWLTLLIHLSVLACTIVPVLGGPVLVKRRQLPLVQLILTLQAVILTLCTLTVLTNVTFEFSRMEVRFGVYITLIGSIMAALYSFLQLQQLHRKDMKEFFHHPEQTPLERSEQRVAPPPPPPPPPPLKPEEHHLHRQ